MTVAGFTIRFRIDDNTYVRTYKNPMILSFMIDWNCFLFVFAFENFILISHLDLIPLNMEKKQQNHGKMIAMAHFNGAVIL